MQSACRSFISYELSRVIYRIRQFELGLKCRAFAVLQAILKAYGCPGAAAVKLNRELHQLPGFSGEYDAPPTPRARTLPANISLERNTLLLAPSRKHELLDVQ